MADQVGHAPDRMSFLDTLDLADVLASMGVVTNGSNASTIVHFRPRTTAPNPFASHNVAPPPLNSSTPFDNLVFRRASAPTPPPPPLRPLWRAATDGHIDPNTVDTSSLLLNTLFQRTRGSGVWNPPPLVTPPQLDDAQLSRLTRRDVYSFSQLSTVFHLPQHKACSELRRVMEAEGQVGYRLSSLKLLIKCYNLQRWPYRKVGRVGLLVW